MSYPDEEFNQDDWNWGEGYEMRLICGIDTDHRLGHECTNPAPYLETVLPGKSGHDDDNWIPVCKRHAVDRKVRLSFDTTQKIWGKMSDTVELLAERLEEFGLGEKQIKEEIDQAFTHAVLHSQFFE